MCQVLPWELGVQEEPGRAGVEQLPSLVASGVGGVCPSEPIPKAEDKHREWMRSVAPDR